MLEQIENKELKNCVEEEISYGMKPVKYEKKETEESVWVDGLGHIQIRLFFNPNNGQVMENYIDKNTNTVINFSDWSEEAKTEVSYYRRRDYKIISIDDIKNPTFILMHNVSYGGEILELEYEYGRFESRIYEMEKVRQYSNYFDQIEEKIKEYNEK